MYTTINKWGASHGIRIPKHMLEAANIDINKQVRLTLVEDKLVIEKCDIKSHKSLKERLKGYNAEYSAKEWATGVVGGEVL